ncbi:unnamed protein product [Soboliphyme baturini]|uniref:TLE_N domain-containing protein n=1 Tax=Soboliphyme baturini TaxID=241478 RepID=A0A183INH4_9BILA|nr:unnamed protein product [Soboliphyme baturini]
MVVATFAANVIAAAAAVVVVVVVAVTFAAAVSSVRAILAACRCRRRPTVVSSSCSPPSHPFLPWSCELLLGDRSTTSSVVIAYDSRTSPLPLPLPSPFDQFSPFVDCSLSSAASRLIDRWTLVDAAAAAAAAAVAAAAPPRSSPMYPNRHPGPPQPGQPFKFTVIESCDRVKEEFNFLQAQYHSTHLAADRRRFSKSKSTAACRSGADTMLCPLGMRTQVRLGLQFQIS